MTTSEAIEQANSLEIKIMAFNAMTDIEKIFIQQVRAAILVYELESDPDAFILQAGYQILARIQELALERKEGQ